MHYNMFEERNVSSHKEFSGLWSTWKRHFSHQDLSSKMIEIRGWYFPWISHGSNTRKILFKYLLLFLSCTTAAGTSQLADELGPSDEILS